MKCAGVCSASIVTRLSAGWMRWLSDSQSSRTRPPICARDDDLTVQHAPRRQLVAKRLEQLRESTGPAPCRLRDCSTTSSPSRNISARNPSHFGSNDHTPASSGTFVWAFASIGSTEVARGVARFPYSRRPLSQAISSVIRVRPHRVHLPESAWSDRGRVRSAQLSGPPIQETLPCQCRRQYVDGALAAVVWWAFCLPSPRGSIRMPDARAPR